ncbi:MAG: hypothetical protein GY847_01530 [Proteobacteria bacterium]|nr:hypothetical protein [Pseudomonadota bacterium]
MSGIFVQNINVQIVRASAFGNVIPADLSSNVQPATERDLFKPQENNTRHNMKMIGLDGRPSSSENLQESIMSIPPTSGRFVTLSSRMETPPGWIEERFETRNILKSIQNKAHVQIFRERKKSGGLQVVVTEKIEADGYRWRHVSLSRKGRIPKYEDVKRIKSIFIGDDKKAIQVFPQKDEHVNLHRYVLHLWHCMDNDPIPDFRERGLI